MGAGSTKPVQPSQPTQPSQPSQPTQPTQSTAPKVNTSPEDQKLIEYLRTLRYPLESEDIMYNGKQLIPDEDYHDQVRDSFDAFELYKKSKGIKLYGGKRKNRKTRKSRKSRKSRKTRRSGI
jgi:hypothetical protein